ncbi:hypothetical protein B5F53_02185 [Blautia sp. An249]|nr:hypothetical protein B5F53_02185 [Blautia sp. An249]
MRLLALLFWNKIEFAKFTWPFMKQIKKVSEKDYCYHVSVIEYALYTEKGKAVVKKTSEISKIAGVSKRTLQYYDDEGMIQVKRSENNYRLYDERALETLWKIMLYKETGMELKEIKKVLSMSEGEKKEFYKKYVEKIENQIQVLEEKKRFILLIMIKGLPPVPEEGSDVTYKSEIAKLRNEYAGDIAGSIRE